MSSCISLWPHLSEQWMHFPWIQLLHCLLLHLKPQILQFFWHFLCNWRHQMQNNRWIRMQFYSKWSVISSQFSQTGAVITDLHENKSHGLIYLTVWETNLRYKFLIISSKELLIHILVLADLKCYTATKCHTNVNFLIGLRLNSSSSFENHFSNIRSHVIKSKVNYLQRHTIAQTYKITAGLRTDIREKF